MSLLKFELLSHKEELNRYAEENVVNQEYQRKNSNANQLERQIKEQDEIIHRLEADVKQQQRLAESLTHENSRMVRTDMHSIS